MKQERQNPDERDAASRSFDEKIDEVPFDPWGEEEEIQERRLDPLRGSASRDAIDLEEDEDTID